MANVHGPQPADAASSGEPLEKTANEGVLHGFLVEATSEHGGETRPEDGDDEDNETHSTVELDSAAGFSVRPGVKAVNHL